MDRRDSLKLLLAVATVPPRLMATSPPARRFEAGWRDWPDMRWVGPEFWGNRLQDWRVSGGTVLCTGRGRNRTLHCLTHRVTGDGLSTGVSVDGSSLLDASPGSLVGFRIGINGRSDDYRSAAVHGRGLDLGIDPTGALRIGSVVSEATVSLTQPLWLEASAEIVPGALSLTLRAKGGRHGGTLAEVSRLDIPRHRLLGNVALLSHFAGAPNDLPAAVFADWVIDGPGVTSDVSAVFGPIMFAQYTVDSNLLKLTAQLAPIDDVAGVAVYLDTRGVDGSWSTRAVATMDHLARTARFRVGGWQQDQTLEYRVRVTIPLRTGPKDFFYHGTVTAEPKVDAGLKAAVFSCNADHGFPDDEVVRNVTAHQPDMALFLGDQFYEGSGGFGIERDSLEEAALDMLHKWYMFGWSYRHIFRHIPAAFIPDDHDVYHGNVWGEAGKIAPTDEGWGAAAQDQGGYKMPAAWVNAVQMAQTSHLPDPVDPEPVEQGIGVYFTRWNYGGVSFAILEDRKFKSAPANVLPAEAQVLNGWIRNPEFDITDHRELPDASLLGERQMRFLADWAEDWSGPTYLKVALSQTNFAAVHTIPGEATSGAVLPGLPMPEPGEYVTGDKLAVDMDSNGWPQGRRDEVLRLLRKCSAFHIAGDQHLATMVQHGIDRFGDACFSFTGPALNNIWPRRWWPPLDKRERALPGGAEYAGDFFDGFGNRITVHAAASPRATGLRPRILRDRVTGYGIVTFDLSTQRIRVECWPRHIHPATGDSGQYEGWPIELDAQSGDGREPVAFLPPLRFLGIDEPVVELRSADGTLIYTRRLRRSDVRLPLFENGRHILRVGDPGSGSWQERVVESSASSEGSIVFSFPA